MEPLPLSDQDHIPDHNASRRAFLKTLTGAVAVGFAVQILGCTEEPLSSDGTGGNNGNCPQPSSTLGKSAATDRSGTVGSNHGHVALVTAAAQDAGQAFLLDITGSASHSHTVSLTTQDVANLKAGAALTKQSSTNGHSHSVTFAMVTTSIHQPC
jgi:hypothetical protein